MTTKGSPEITPDVTRKIAALAKIEISEQDILTYTEQLQKVMEHVEKLKSAPVKPDTEPLYSPHPANARLREDIVKEFEDLPDGSLKMTEHAPDVLYDGYRVPQIL